MFRKSLPDTPKTRTFLDKLPKIYLVAKWASYGYLKLPFTKKYKRIKIGYLKPIYQDVPMVYSYYDNNGEYPHWVLCPITSVTTGAIYGWYTNKNDAELVVDSLNKKQF